MFISGLQQLLESQGYTTRGRGPEAHQGALRQEHHEWLYTLQLEQGFQPRGQLEAEI